MSSLRQPRDAPFLGFKRAILSMLKGVEKIGGENGKLCLAKKELRDRKRDRKREGRTIGLCLSKCIGGVGIFLLP